jgi:hypothetical protein
VELPLYRKDYRISLLRHPAAQWTADIYRQFSQGVSKENRLLQTL